MRVTETRLRGPARGWQSATGAAVLVSALLGLAQPAAGAGAGKFVPPSGCESFATIQNRACSVTLVAGNRLVSARDARPNNKTMPISAIV